MAINKVEYGGNTLIDLTSDSVTPENLLSGVTAHDASGKKITGTFDSDKYLEKTGDASDTTVTFTQATSRTNIYSKEKLSVIMGKIAKFFADLKTVAVTGKYSDLSGTPGVVSKTANGLCPKNGGTTTKFLRDDGTYAEPTASVSGLSTLEQVTAAATAGNVTDPVGAGAVNELNSSFGGMTFGVDSDGNYGYIKAGADTVTPFNNGSSIYLITQITVTKFSTDMTSKENLYINDDYIKIDLTNNRINILKDIPNAVLLSRAYYSAIYKNGIILQDCTGRNGNPFSAPYPKNYIQTNLQAGDYLEVYSGDSTGLTHVICIYSLKL